MKWFLCALAILIAAPVWAADPKLPTGTPGLHPQAAAEPDWRGLLAPVRQQRDQETQARQDVQAELAVTSAALAKAKSEAETSTKLLSDTNAYWQAWCGDKPGCALPAVAH